MASDIVPAKFTSEARVLFLEELALTGRKVHSAAYAGVCRQTVADHAEADPEFASAIEEALERYREQVRAEVRRRAIEGWLEPVFGKDGQHWMYLYDSNGELVMEDREVDERGPDGAPTGKRITKRVPKMVPAFVRKYSDRMLELEAKRVDPGYREKGSIDMNVTGGVLVVPGMASEQEFERKYGAQRRIIEGEKG